MSFFVLLGGVRMGGIHGKCVIGEGCREQSAKRRVADAQAPHGLSLEDRGAVAKD